MKIWFDTLSLRYNCNDYVVKFGIGWYRHNKNHKWHGLTIHIYFWPWMVIVNAVDNYEEYDKRINRRLRNNK